MLVSLAGSEPIFRQIYQSMRTAILTGKLPAGKRIPSTRELSDQLKVSRTVVLLAFDQLRAEGYIRAKPGSGTYVADVIPDSVLAVEVVGAGGDGKGKPVRKARLSAYARRVRAESPPFVRAPAQHPFTSRYNFKVGALAKDDFPHSLWARLMRRHARSLESDYGPVEGYLALRTGIAAYLRRARAVHCDVEQVVVVSGARQAFDLVARLLVDPGDAVVIEEPHYSGFRHPVAAAGARLLPIPVDRDGLQVHRLRRLRSPVRLAYVTPSHQFPAGGILSLSRRAALLEWAEQRGVYVVEDDYDAEFQYESRPVESLQALDRSGLVIYVGSFSKVLSPDLRLGFVVLPGELVNPFVQAKMISDRQCSLLLQRVLADFVNEGHFERHLRRIRRRHASRRAAVLEAVDEYLGERAEVSGANAGVHILVWLHNTSPAQSPSLVEAAGEAGIALTTVDRHFLSPPNRIGLVLGYAAMGERKIREGIRRLAQVVNRVV